jgi:ElaB/YqjD/DUF883 family membrane-anchored ribosome-binding protein
MVETTAKLNSSAWDKDANDPQVIRARIEQTRANMSQLVDAIQTKLSPEQLTREAKQKVKEATIGKVEAMANTVTYKANNWRSQILETVKRNPIPAALVGIGVGWLLMENARTPAEKEEHTYTYPERHYGSSVGATTYYPEQGRFSHTAEFAENISPTSQRVQRRVGAMTDTIQTKASEMVSNVQAKAGEVAGSVQSQMDNIQAKAGEMVSNVQARAGEVAGSVQSQVRDQTNYLAHQTQYQVDRAKRGFQSTLEENPLAVGAVAVAAGAVLGLMIPITQKENELMGETRDHLMKQAQTTTTETFKKVEHAAEEAYRAAVETVEAEGEPKGTAVAV